MTRALKVAFAMSVAALCITAVTVALQWRIMAPPHAPRPMPPEESLEPSWPPWRPPRPLVCCAVGACPSVQFNAVTDTIECGPDSYAVKSYEHVSFPADGDNVFCVSEEMTTVGVAVYAQSWTNISRETLPAPGPAKPWPGGGELITIYNAP